MIAQYAPSGSRQALYVQSLARIDELLSVTNTQGRYWYETDALGSVYTLTTSTGAVQARGGYDVFGEPVALGGTAVGQPFGFTGREHEADAGLVYARARYLQPGIGRWTAADPAGFVDGMDRYAFVRSQATQMTDPWGLWGNSELVEDALFATAITLRSTGLSQCAIASALVLVAGQIASGPLAAGEAMFHYGLKNPALLATLPSGFRRPFRATPPGDDQAHHAVAVLGIALFTADLGVAVVATFDVAQALQYLIREGDAYKAQGEWHDVLLDAAIYGIAPFVALDFALGWPRDAAELTSSVWCSSCAN